MGCILSQENHSIVQLHRRTHVNRKRGSSIDNYISCFKFSKFIEKVHKTSIQLSAEDKQLLNKTFADHFLFYRLPKSQRNRVIQHIQVYECQEGIQIFKKGESATLFFIIRSGNVQIITNTTNNNNQQRILLSRGNYFGDLALLYTAVRSATAKSLNKCTFFCVPNYVFKQITQQMAKKNYELAKAFIEKTTIFNYLSKRQKNVIAYNTLFLRYQKNQQIFHEGDDSNSLYVVTAGVVQIRIAGKPAIEMRPGDSFGQSSFRQNQPRSGTAVATQLTSLLSISRQSLCKCLGKQLQQISFYNILKWAFNRNQLLKQISKLQKQKLINCAELRQYQNQQIICREGQKVSQIAIVLEQKINNQEVGAIFNIEQFTTQFQNETKNTRNLIKNGKGFIALISFKSLNSVLGKSLRKILPIPSQQTQNQLVCEDINKLELSDLTIRQLIEENQLCKVYCVIDQMKRVYTIKCISKESIQARNMELYLIHEKQLMETLQFSFIVKLYKTFKDENFVYFLTNYIEGVDFLDVLQQIGVCNKKKAQFFIGCLILSLEYLHEKNIIYSDLKPENVVVDTSGFLNLNNFQIAKILRQQAGHRTFTVVGTPHYMAPQIISVSGYSFPIDLWSLGVMTFEMLFGYLPFGNDSKDPYLIFKQIDTKQIVIPKTYEDYTGKQLILKLLSKNPSDRSVQQFAKLKAMSYFDNFDWDSLQKRVIQTPFKIKSRINEKKFNKSLVDTLKKQKIVSNKQSQNTIWNDF